MRPEDMLQVLHMQPFERVRLCISDAAEHEIRHPEMAFVERSTVGVGVPGPREPQGPAQCLVNCAPVHTTRTEPINGDRKRN